MKREQVKIPALYFGWRWHNEHDRRVWRSDWAGDQFEVLDDEAFKNLEYFALRWGFPVLEALDARIVVIPSVREERDELSQSTLGAEDAVFD